MRRGMILLALAGALGCGLVGCTDKPQQPQVATANGNASPAGDSADPAEDPARRERQLIECMRREGVEVADPVPGEPPGNVIRHELDERGKGRDLKFQDALEKCSRYLPQISTSSAPPDVETIAKRREFAKCMREHGLPDFPDPDPQTGEIVYTDDQGGETLRVSPKADSVYMTDNPAVAAAFEQCRTVLPPSRTNR
jgi:hypothetical protein